ncbi:hypothetical protein M407DRAFT_5465 [Tulasnella calospora MUT 4182]|uniref:Uncharacterized protein n=1 Tax=Tulasnella calospora MUT 4182 TaxID=1051891 RepID=A0A0C3MAI8_9AGAM|nr:hypothetical protein M407DRAFT_5465 [Tulasnella calospora MUT 4182]
MDDLLCLLRLGEQNPALVPWRYNERLVRFRSEGMKRAPSAERHKSAHVERKPPMRRHAQQPSSPSKRGTQRSLCCFNYHPETPESLAALWARRRPEIAPRMRGEMCRETFRGKGDDTIRVHSLPRLSKKKKSEAGAQGIPNNGIPRIRELMTVV